MRRTTTTVAPSAVANPTPEPTMSVDPSGTPRRTRRRAASIVRTLLLAVVAAVAIAVTWAGVASARRIGRVHAMPRGERPLPVRGDSAAVARGRHLATALATCTACHGADLGGAVYADMGPMGVVAGPNLTRGRGGRGGTLGDADWERAVRHGLRRDGTSLIMMPSEVFYAMSDGDLAAIVAFARQVPPVDREVPPSRFGPLGRALLAAGRLPFLVAEKTPSVPHVSSVTPAPTAAYGRYLAEIGGCRGCHGFGLSGGRVGGPPGTPHSANLTRAGIPDWTEADFVRAMRTGRRPDGSAIVTFMPWQLYRGMTDDELHALWLYLRSVPPRATGNK